MSGSEHRGAPLPPTVEDLHFRNFDSEDEINVFAASTDGDGFGSSPSQSPDIPQPLPRPSALAAAASSSAPDSPSSSAFISFADHGADVPESDIGDADTEQLLGSDDNRPNNASFWTFEYYQQFFDVSSADVGRRLFGSMVPRPGDNFLQTTIRPNPDLYGPAWVAITLVFATGICGNLSNYFASLAGKGVDYRFSFHTVNVAATVILCYWFLVPSGLHLLFWWRKSRCDVTYLESICLYGYSLAVYVPVCLLWLIPVRELQILVTVVGSILSGSVLVTTFWPTVRGDDKRVALAIVGAILLFHGLLALGFMLYFFHPAPMVDVGPTVAPTNSTSAPTITTPAPTITTLARIGKP